MLNYQTLVRAAGHGFGRAIAVEDDRVAYTYEEFHARSTSFAAGLLAMGLVKGDCVVWLSPNRADYLVTYFGTAKAGLRCAPINFWLRNNEVKAAIEVAAPRLIVAAPEYAERLAEVCEGLDIEFLVQLPGEEPLREGWRSWDSCFADVDPDTIFDSDEHTPHEIIFTSGTTGQVKGATRTQRQRILEALTTIVVNPQGDHGRLQLRGSPQFHVGGATGPLQTLIQGGRTRIYKFNPEEMVEHIRQGVTHINGVPAQYQILFESGLLDGVDTSAVLYCGIGGNGAAPEQFRQIQAAFPNAVLAHFYGSTESGMVTCIRGAEFHKRLRSVGRAAPGVDLRIVAADGAVLGAGQVGEVEMRAEHTMTEYYRRPDLTGPAFTEDGYLRMGDLGYVDEDGYLFIVGRSKDMIISGGENIYPKEVEDVASGVPGVFECAVIGVPDPVFEERVLAIVKPGPGRPASDEEFAASIIAGVRAELAGYKAPKEIHIVDEFPRNALGKIDKVALRAQYGGGDARS